MTDWNVQKLSGTHYENLFRIHFVKDTQYERSAGSTLSEWDFKVNDITYEIKRWTCEDAVIVEEWSNANESLKQKIEGWYYKTKADFIVYVSEENRKMLFLKFSEFKKWYEPRKQNYTERFNKPSTRSDGDVWQSSFKIIPLEDVLCFLKIATF